MKKRVPLVLTIIFLSAFIIFSGIFIYINCSPIKFKDIYGSRSELGDVDLVFYKDRDIFGEEITVGAETINRKNVINERRFDGIDVLKDKKFFRGIYPTRDTFFEDDDVMVDVTNIYGNGIQKLEVRFKDKKTNTYETFKVKVDEYIRNNNIDKVTYKDGKINILFSMNYEENNIVFGEINLSDKKFNIVDIINLDEKLDLNRDYSHINSVRQKFGMLPSTEEDKVYYKLTELDNTDKRGIYSNESIIELNVNTREIKRYNPNDEIRDEMKKSYFDANGKGGTMFEAYGEIYITQTSDEKTSVLVFNTKTKEFKFYKDLIENERLKRYGVNVRGLSEFIIVENKVIANFVKVRDDGFVSGAYLAVIDIPSRNPVYIGELEYGYLSDIKIAGGK
ncbi:hypothetical protein [Clostridium perfringens]|uniref:hypothetical protein n=1 Tax=Clostridium perfringens TaxID=1502 RepID=UPI00016BD5C8|nr:hypothetical protein [Clostridium perfringens]EDT79471.1 hypothetical protein AC7_2287 [Clostridium perfringens NCTC 8239]ELC8382092.1 hypothetical protein [Clostridium perfringens]MDT7913501.1 hypothetical protein [Clostridium perfringens]MDT7926562.1 hypothetical protein [Clostridium perfringens]MDT7957349.1 hypothetical protein [Clostridium perfringens]